MTCFPDADAKCADLESQIDKLAEKIEYEHQPNLVFEKQNKELQDKVCCVVYLRSGYG